MLGRFRNAFYNVMGGVAEGAEAADSGLLPSRGSRRLASAVAAPGSETQDTNVAATSASASRVKYAYQRPIFLQLFSNDEIQVTADHQVRPIIVPRDVHILPWYSGYAEAINAGKSLRNEDQAVFHRGVLRTQDSTDDSFVEEWEIPYVYFGIFDGHAGSGCAVAAANELHQTVHKRLMAVLKHLIPGGELHQVGSMVDLWLFSNRGISVETLIIGALESAFWEMDAQIGEDKKRYKMLGGCTALVALFILGKLYVANAGDSRAVWCRDRCSYPMSFDFTPVTERQRLQQLGFHKPHLLGSEYSRLDFSRLPRKEDLGKTMLYRDAFMTGWTYKEITYDDLKFPMVFGEGKRSRLLATIGVTRGLGDHDLRAQSQGEAIYIKPFLSAQPEVRVLDVENEGLGDSDVLVMATDGLWDVVSNEKVAAIVDDGLKLYEAEHVDVKEDITTTTTNNHLSSRRIYRFITIAQDLVMAARGKLNERHWICEDNSAATIDDISVFVIPITAFKQEYAAWINQNAGKLAAHPKSSQVNGKTEAGPANEKVLPEACIVSTSSSSSLPEDGQGDDSDSDENFAELNPGKLELSVEDVDMTTDSQ